MVKLRNLRQGRTREFPQAMEEQPVYQNIPEEGTIITDHRSERDLSSLLVSDCKVILCSHKDCHWRDESKQEQAHSFQVVLAADEVSQVRSNACHGRSHGDMAKV